jgi:gas vesicle protein
MSERDGFDSFLIGFIIGGIAGAIVALLLAPSLEQRPSAWSKKDPLNCVRQPASVLTVSPNRSANMAKKCILNSTRAFQKSLNPTARAVGDQRSKSSKDLRMSCRHG